MQTLIIRFGVALGIGLLIGVERERHKQASASGSAGVRTMALIALLGAIGGVFAQYAEGLSIAIIISSLSIVIAGFALALYQRQDQHRTAIEGKEPGITTEIAMLVTLALGMLSIYQPALAASLGIVVVILLVTKRNLKIFATKILTEAELQDALILLAATLIVMPLLPDQAVDPFGAIVPRSIWMIMIAVMAVGAIGHIVKRILGVNHGLPLAGFVSGFVSSLATVGAMGAESRKNPKNTLSAASGATFSSLATVILLVIVVAIVDINVVYPLIPIFVSMGIVTAIYCYVLTIRAEQSLMERQADETRAFDLKQALIFTLTVSIVLFIATIVTKYFGSTAVLFVAGLAGFVDAHSASFSVASLASHGEIDIKTAALGVLIAFSTNALLKVVAAALGGNRKFFLWVSFGVVLSVAAAWCGALFSGLFA